MLNTCGRCVILPLRSLASSSAPCLSTNAVRTDNDWLLASIKCNFEFVKFNNRFSFSFQSIFVHIIE